MKADTTAQTHGDDFALSVGLYNALGKLLRKLRKQSGKQPFSSTEQATMALLESSGQMLPSELAEAHHISAQGISQIVNRLFDQGIIDKHPDPTDKRKVYLSLNKKGLQELLSIRVSRSQWLSETVTQTLNPADKIILQKAVVLLNRLAANPSKDKD